MTKRVGVSKRSGFALLTVMDILDYAPDMVVQVGVGSHYEEAHMMREKWPDIELIGFEANPETSKAEQNKYPGKLIRMAVGNYDGNIDFYLKKNHGDGSSVHQMENSKAVKVPCTKLDSWIDQSVLPKNILLWLDCEGGELDVLRGGEHFIRCAVDVINIEMTSNPPMAGWCDMITTHRFLRYLGFKRQTAHSNRSWAGQVDSIYVKEHLWQAKYCTCPCSFLDE